MYSKPKGLVYILNNYQFVGGRRRLGSDVDFENMSYLFHQLGYVLEKHENLKAKVSNVHIVMLLFIHALFTTVSIGHSLDLRTQFGSIVHVIISYYFVTKLSFPKATSIFFSNFDLYLFNEIAGLQENNLNNCLKAV